MEQTWGSGVVSWTIARTLSVLQNFCNINKIREHCRHCGISPQSLKMPSIFSADTATLAARDLIEALKITVPDEPFGTLNDTHHAALQSIVDIINITPKDAEKQITNRQNGIRSRMQYFPSGPNHVSAPVAHMQPKRQRQKQAPDPRVPETPELNPVTPPKVAPRVVPLVTQEEIYHMAPIIPTTMHDMAKKI